MKILALDSSCDESCAAIVDTDSWRLLADVVFSHVSQMQSFGGIVPEIASREHLKGIPFVTQEALTKAQLKLEDIDWFAVTNKPGLIGALLVGLNFTKSLAFATGKPFSVLNHLEGHLFSPLLASFDGGKAPAFPWIALLVSGGHTELYHVKSASDFEWLGGTLDDAAGEAYDKVGKLLGLNYPAGPAMDRIAKEFISKLNIADLQKRFNFPKSLPHDWDFSYSGLKTAISLAVKKAGTLDDTSRALLVTAAQEAILAPLVERGRQALKEFPGTNLVVTGGVACNSRLRALLPEAHFPLPRHCTDNAAMMALRAALLHREGKLNPAELSATAFAR